MWTQKGVAPAEKDVPTATRGRVFLPLGDLSARCTPRAVSGTSPASSSCRNTVLPVATASSRTCGQCGACFAFDRWTRIEPFMAVFPASSLWQTRRDSLIVAARSCTYSTEMVCISNMNVLKRPPVVSRSLQLVPEYSCRRRQQPRLQDEHM